MRRLLVGIDLGTTNTTCSVADSLPDGTAGQITPLHILQFLHPPGAQNCFGPHDVLPSVVGLGSDGTVYTGLRAKTAAPELLSQHFRIVRDIKRQLGNPSWQVLLANRTLRPRHISALLLATVKRSLDAAYPDAVIEKLVLTTPASFSSMMRQETLAAADIAGFDPRTIDLLDEPVAALLSSLIQTPSALRPTWSGKPVLVFDMGGGTLDASIISISDTSRTVEILATSRYHEFAGNDIDLELAALLLQRIRASHDYDGFLEIHPPVGTASPALQIGLGLLSVGEQVKLNLSQLLQNGPQVGGIQNKLNHFRSSPTFVVADLTLDFNVSTQPCNCFVVSA